MKRRRFIRWVAGGTAAAASAGLLLLPDRRTREVHRVQSRIQDFARTLSFGERDAPFRRLAYAGNVSDYFEDPTEFDVTLGARTAQGAIPRSQIVEGAAGIRATARGLTVEFFDIAVTMNDDFSSARAHLTAKIFFTGDPDYFVQEFRVQVRKSDHAWKIQSLSTVRTMLQ